MTSTTKLLELLDPGRCASQELTPRGYINVLNDVPQASTIGARAMRTGFYPVLYERMRPIGLRLASGLAAPGRDGDREQLLARLELTEGQTVLDIACGPGNFTAFLGGIVGDNGLAAGLDASDSMLAKAVATNQTHQSAYIRGDAENLPFESECFDAACCLAALYLMNDPYAAIREAARVLRPGGRFAILTSYSGSDLLTRLAMTTVDKVTGIRRFGRDDITGAFRGAGLVNVHQDIQGLTQAVWGSKLR